MSHSFCRLELLKEFIWLFTGKEWNEEKTSAHDEHDNNLSSNRNPKNDSKDFKILLEEAQSIEKEIKDNYQRYMFLPLTMSEKLIEIKYKYKLTKDAVDQQTIDNQTYVKINLGYAKALLNSSNYSILIQFLKSHKINSKLIREWKFWFIGAKAHRKMFNYKNASNFIQQSSSLGIERQEDLIEIAKETDIIMKLIDTKPEKYLEEKIQLRDNILFYDSDYYSKMRSEEKPNYNVLSLDGGGIRGILTCVWLDEIEIRTKRPISHMFNMICGVSTGAIIGSALTLPKLVNNKLTKIPIYSSGQVLDIYLNESSNIFTEKRPFYKRIFSSAYSNIYLSNLMEKFAFKDYKLTNSLCDLIVPAVSKERPTKTFVFSSKKALKNKNLDFSYYDMLMSSTAAPTYFDPHSVPNYGLFVDGGLTFNDPTMLAYRSAKDQGISDDNLFVLSLGTGTCLAEMKSNSGGIIDYLFNHQNYMFGPQAGDTESFMRNLNGLKYDRWQVITEDELKLDDCNSDNRKNLIELGRQYLEDLYASDDNYFNKLLENLEQTNNNQLECQPIFQRLQHI